MLAVSARRMRLTVSTTVSSVAAPSARPPAPLLSLLSAISPLILPESKAKVFYTLPAGESL
jgi:hypothetical protein